MCGAYWHSVVFYSFSWCVGLKSISKSEEISLYNNMKIGFYYNCYGTTIPIKKKLTLEI